MARKIWLIGVGGSGSKTLRFAKASLERRLSKVDGFEGFPDGWRFLSIDLPKDLETDNAVPSDLRERSEYVGVAPPAKEYRVYDASLVGRAPVREEFVRWRPDPETVSQPPWLGAGQFRAIGRTVLLDQLKEVHDALQTGYSVLTSLSTRQQFNDLNAALGGQGSGGDPLVVVVGSIAGGTGAGTFLDVSDLIAAAIPQGWAATHSAFLYMPSVFDSLAESARTGVEANSYWSACELLNAAWDTRAHLPHLTAAGVPAAAALRRGAPYNFFIGREAGVQLSDPNTVYATVGELLAQLAMDDEFASNFETLTIGNFAATGHVFRSAALGSANRVPVAGLGFSRFGLGRDRFEDYTIDRLVRSAIDHIVLAHEAKAEQAAGATGNPGENRAEKVATVVNQRDGILVQQFVKDLGLSERGEQRNDVLEALLPVASYDEQIAQFRKRVDGLAQEGTRGLAKFDQWLKRVEDTLATQRPDFMKQMNAVISSNASKWAAELPDRFSEVVSSYVRDHGGWVTLELLNRLDEELAVVLKQLPDERERREANAIAASASAWKELGQNRREGKYESDTLQNAVGILFDTGIRGQVGSIMRSTAVSLLSDLRTSLLQPFVLRFAATLEELTAYRESTAFRDLSRESVADRLRPAETEILLVEVNDYPAELDRLLRITIGDVAAPVEEASKLMLDDRELPDSVVRSTGATSNHRLASLGQWRWVVDRMSQVPQQRVGFSAAELRRRAALYLRKDLTSGIGQYLSEDLSTYLERCDAAGLEHFKTQFRMAIDVAQPLLSVDQDSLTHLYSSAPPKGSFTMTPLPLPLGTPGRTAAEAVLLAAGVSQTNVASYFAKGAVGALDGARISAVSISSQTAPVHPAAIRDLRDPVLRKWRQGHSGFSYARRARSRTETIPLQRSVLQQIFAGRELGRFLGLVSVGPDGTTYEVLDTGSWLALPNVGPEGAAVRDDELFEVALEGYGMELFEHADAGQRASSLRAFDVLYEYGQVTGTVEKWIVSGELPDGALGPEPPVAGDGPSERRDALVTWLLSRRRELEADSVELARQQFASRSNDFARLGADAVTQLLDEAIPKLVSVGSGTGTRKRG